jgi:hypothetical protein
VGFIFSKFLQVTRVLTNTSLSTQVDGKTRHRGTKLSAYLEQGVPSYSPWTKSTHHLLLQMKFYWNRAQPFAPEDYCFGTRIELSSCKRDRYGTQSPNYYSLSFYREFLLVAGLEEIARGWHSQVPQHRQTDSKGAPRPPGGGACTAADAKS